MRIASFDHALDASRVEAYAKSYHEDNVASDVDQSSDQMSILLQMCACVLGIGAVGEDCDACFTRNALI